MHSYKTEIILHTKEIIITFLSAVITNILIYNFTASIDEDFVLLWALSTLFQSERLRIHLIQYTQFACIRCVSVALKLF